MMEQSKETVLSMQNISKEFPGVKALDNVSIDLKSGTVTAIIGENGAGKSTLMKVLSGIYQDYSGNILLAGEQVKLENPKHAQDLGVAIIHQELNLIPYLSVSENIFLGRELMSSLGLLERVKMDRIASEVLARLGQSLKPSALVGRLKVGQQQMVEIAKALIVDASIIIMDEPTSALSDQEVEQLFRVIKDLKSQGKAVVYISHKMKEIFTIADEFVVLRDGRYIDSGKISGTSLESIIRKMTGRDIRAISRREEPLHRQECLQVKRLSLRTGFDLRLTPLKDISFSLFKGEILGIYGLMGAGRTELLESIFGLHYANRDGEIIVHQKAVTLKSPKEAINSGLALIPEDRKSHGLVLQMDIVKNTSLASLTQFERYGILDNGSEKELAGKYAADLAIKTPSVRKRVSQLSGGNQQKVVLAKWLATEPDIILFDEPTRGIDINAKSEIYELIYRLSARGKGIILASSELPEILTVSDRVLVMCEGRLTADFLIDQASEEKIMAAALPNQ